MRHRRHTNTLSVEIGHRKALLRNLVKSLVIRKRIQTTLAKAKAASSLADSMVQIAKRGDLNARRLLISKLGCADAAHSLITNIAPHFKDRQGGYTRVLRLGVRRGDGAQTALLEFTTVIEAPQKSKKPKKEKKPKDVKQKEHKHLHVHEEAPEKPEKKKKEKEEEVKAQEKRPASDKESEKKESAKKGGFLSALRKFLKGDEQ